MRSRPVIVSALVAVLGAALALGTSGCSSQSDGLSLVPPSAHPGASAPKSTPTPTTTPLPKVSLTPNLQYVALGDSFAAGMGTGDEAGGCLRSPDLSYPSQFAERAHVGLVRNAACSGATTADLLKKQLDWLSDSTGLVTVSIGGNDLDVATLAAICTEGTDSKACQAQFGAGLDLLAKLPTRLAKSYAAIEKAAPNARIVVTGYAQLFDTPSQKAANFQTVNAVNTATSTLNGVIADAVTAQREQGATISYVEPNFADHGIGSDNPWVNADGAAQFHPNTAGYRAYAKALLASLK